MGLREVTGFIAHALLAGYWVWMISCTAAQLRGTSRSHRLRVQVALIKTAGVAVTAVVVGVVHFWATQWWQIVVTVLVAAPVGIALRHLHRRLVIAPRHRRALVQRARVHTPILHGHRHAADTTRIRGAVTLAPGQVPPAPGVESPRRPLVAPLPVPDADRPSRSLRRWWTSPADPAAPNVSARDLPARDVPGPAARDSTAPW